MSSKEERKDSSEKERKPRRKLKREAEGAAGALSVDKKSKTSLKGEVKQKADLKTKNVVSTVLKIPVTSQIYFSKKKDVEDHP